MGYSSLVRHTNATTCTSFLCAIALLGLSACVTDDWQPVAGSEHGDHFDLGEHVPDDMIGETVWLTIGADAEDAVREAIADGDIAGVFHKTDRTSKNSGALVLEVPRENLQPLSVLMHERFNRCSGYMAHDSFDAAVAALDPGKIDKAVGQKLVSYSIDNGAAVNALTPVLSQSNLISIISHLSTQYTNRYHSTPNGTLAAEWLQATWQGYATASGRSDITVELYHHSVTTQPSVVMTIPGDWNPEEVVVIGGHLDSTVGGGTGPSTSAPGADDNASGTATFTEVARVLLSQGFYPDRTVKFMAYAAEEVGLRGSNEIANDYLAQGIDVVGVLQLDMTNYHGSSEDIVLVDDYTNNEQNAFIGSLIDTYFPTLSWGYSSCGYACSDHASWTGAGFPASIPFESRVGQHNPYIHTGNDTLANSDGTGTHAIKFARLAVAYIAELAKGDFADDWTPPPGTTAELYPNSLGVYETRHYGPYPVKGASAFDARLDSTGYADVYVRFGAAPTTTEWDCRPYSSNPREVCSMTAPATDTDAYIMVRGYNADYTLRLAYYDSTPPPTQVTQDYPNNTVPTGAIDNYGPFDVAVGTTFNATTTGPSGDADLYVKFGTLASTTIYDCKSTSSNSNESCTIEVPVGQTEAYVGVHGWSAASYDLSVTYYTPPPSAP